MAKPRLFGADYSVYVRIARLAFAEKQVDCELVPVDVFAPDGVPKWYLEHHPFGRIPAFEHDGVRLFETSAITRYIDEAFSGPPLQPAEPRQRAVMNQIIAMLDAYAYRAMVWDVAVESLEKSAPDEALIASGLARADTALKALASLKSPGPFLLGERITLADLHAAPIIAYFTKAAAGQALLDGYPALLAWLEEFRGRHSFRVTEPTG